MSLFLVTRAVFGFQDIFGVDDSKDVAIAFLAYPISIIDRVCVRVRLCVRARARVMCMLD